MTLTDEERVYLIGLTLAGVVAASAEVKRTESVPLSKAHADAVRELATACAVLTRLRTVHHAVAEPPYDGGTAEFTGHGMLAMRDLGPHDPRAGDPHCIHGKPFSEPCDACAPPSEWRAPTA